MGRLFLEQLKEDSIYRCRRCRSAICEHKMIENKVCSLVWVLVCSRVLCAVLSGYVHGGRVCRSSQERVALPTCLRRCVYLIMSCFWVFWSVRACSLVDSWMATIEACLHVEGLYVAIGIVWNVLLSYCCFWCCLRLECGC